MDIDFDPKYTTVLLRSPGDVMRRIQNAITELDRLDAGLGPSRPGHSIRDAAHDLRTLRDELRDHPFVDNSQ
mgnify:CR=1 FL=1